MSLYDSVSLASALIRLSLSLSLFLLNSLSQTQPRTPYFCLHFLSSSLPLSTIPIFINSGGPKLPISAIGEISKGATTKREISLDHHRVREIGTRSSSIFKEIQNRTCVIYQRYSCNSTTGAFASSFENASVRNGCGSRKQQRKQEKLQL
ncbi:hypothetical protein HYC85_012044 [Camellia sinensis]|uniref:Uncharacterized protein n=1 Tax=Camellia sinensis TaxID=4442 RepID=A0A7J7HCV1_CAMSI|nr:hypothetical protein HYC85_012044 [Camellia sinensis]